MVVQMGTRAQFGALEHPAYMKPSRRNIRGRQGFVPKGFFGAGPMAPKSPQDTGDTRRQQLLNYVEGVQEQSVQQFMDQHHGLVANAMVQTTQNIVGQLPPSFFEVKISAAGNDLAELMLRTILTAYMMRNALYRMELQSSLTPVRTTTSVGATTAVLDGAPMMRGPASWDEDVEAATITLAPAPGDEAVNGDVVLNDFLSDTTYAPGVQKTKVQGEVLRWHVQDERLVTMPAADYMALLEAELAEAREQLRQVSSRAARNVLPVALAGSSGRGAGVVVAGPLPPASANTMSSAAAKLSNLVRWGPKTVAGSFAAASAGAAFGGAVGFSGRGNQLVEYMMSLTPECFQSLKDGASKDIVDAMNAFVTRLMGTSDMQKLRNLSSEFSAEDLSKVLVWIMVVGFTLRSMEARFDMEDALQLPFPPGPGAAMLPHNFNMLFPPSLNVE